MYVISFGVLPWRDGSTLVEKPRVRSLLVNLSADGVGVMVGWATAEKSYWCLLFELADSWTGVCVLGPSSGLVLWGVVWSMSVMCVGRCLQPR